MNNYKRIIVMAGIILVFFTMPISCWGESQSLFLAGTTLELGMSEDQVAQKLAHSDYKLKVLGGPGDFVIISKSGPPFDAPGTLVFENGKLCRICKNWGTFHGAEACLLGKALFSALSHRKDNIAVISTQTQREPTFTTYHIHIVLQNEKHITIDLLDIKGQDSNISVFEKIEKTP